MLNDEELSLQPKEDTIVNPPTTVVSQPWRSCCFIIDQTLVKFFTKMFFISIIMALCLYKLIYSLDCTSQIAYSSLLSVIIGLLFGQRKM